MIYSNFTYYLWITYMIYFVDIDDTICYNTTDKTNYRLAKPYYERINKINSLFDEGNIIIY